MKPFLLVIFLLSSIPLTAQTQQKKQYDFSTVDLKSIDRQAVARQLEYIQLTSGADSLQQLYKRARLAQRPDYFAPAIGYQVDFARLSYIRNSLRALGFDDISENLGARVFGAHQRGRKFMFSYYFAGPSKKKAQNDTHDAEIEGISFSTALGYDVLNHQRLSFYPQLALMLQGFEINIKRKDAYLDITDAGSMMTNPAETEMVRRSLNLTYGGEVEYRIFNSQLGYGLILALRYGRVLPVYKGSYFVNGKKSSFDSDDRISEEFTGVTLKMFVNRITGKKSPSK